MLKFEQKLADWLDKNRYLLFLLSISLAALLLRYMGKEVLSKDYIQCLEPWFNAIKANGGLRGIDKQVGNYGVVYQFIIALLTYIPINPLYLYKAVSVVFDFVLAIATGKLVCEMTGGKRIHFALGYSIVLLLPSVIFNSALWAQCDSMYVSMIVFSLYYLFKERYVPAFVFIGIAFSLKFQTVFMLPFMLYLYFTRRKFSILLVLIPIAIVVVTCLLCGRNPIDTFMVYFGQANTYKKMYLHFPSFWTLVTHQFSPMGAVSLIMTVGILGIGLFCVLARKKFMENRETRFYMLIWTVWTCLTFLPAMHERYAYMLEILLVVAAFMNLRLLPAAMMVQTSTVLTTSFYLFRDEAAVQDWEAYAVPLFLIAYAAFTCYMLYLGLKQKPERAS